MRNILTYTKTLEAHDHLRHMHGRRYVCACMPCLKRKANPRVSNANVASSISHLWKTHASIKRIKPTTWRGLRGWDIAFSCASLYQARRMHTNIQNGRCSKFFYILASWRLGTHTSFVQVAPWVTGRKYMKRSNHVLRSSNWMCIGIFSQNLCKW